MNSKSNNVHQPLDFLSGLALFDNLQDQEIESIFSLMKVKNYRKGEIFSIDLDNRPRLYITYDGQFKLTKVNERGDEILALISVMAKIITNK